MIQEQPPNPLLHMNEVLLEFCLCFVGLQYSIRMDPHSGDEFLPKNLTWDFSPALYNKSIAGNSYFIEAGYVSV